MVTYTVEPESLSALLPDGFRPEIREMNDGSSKAFVSAVTFLDLGFRANILPYPRFTFGQTNYRAYVIHENRRVCWFFGTSLATPFVEIPRRLWGMPWHHAKMESSSSWSGEICHYLEKETTGAWGDARLRIKDIGDTQDCLDLDGFEDEEDCQVMLTHPMEGFFLSSSGKVSTYSVWHEKMRLRKAVAEHANFSVFENLGLVAPGRVPHSVLYQDSIDYTIYLPPKVV